MKNRLIILTMAMVLLLKLSPGLAADDDIALVWAQPGKYSLDIVYSNYVDGKWTEPFYLTANKLNDATPAIVGDAQGNQWVMWSEANGELASALKYRIKDATTGTWSDERLFENGIVYNSLPSLVRDKSDRIWCFWAGVDGQDDEIYYSQFGAGKWNKPQRLNPEDNAVPDFMPQPSLQGNGQPTVSWLGFDLATKQYRYFRSDLKDRQWTPPRIEALNPFKTKVMAKDIVLPPQLAQQTMAVYDRRNYPYEAFYFNRGL